MQVAAGLRATSSPAWGGIPESESTADQAEVRPLGEQAISVLSGGFLCPFDTGSGYILIPRPRFPLRSQPGTTAFLLKGPSAPLCVTSTVPKQALVLTSLLTSLGVDGVTHLEVSLP